MRSPQCPRLRRVEVTPIQADRKVYVVLRDPLNIAGQALVLPVETHYILSLLDGEHSILDIQAEYVRRLGTLVMSDDIRALVDRLDEALLLEGPRFEEAKGRALAGFRRLSIRPPAHAGTAYDARSAPLRDRLDEFFRQDGGPGPVRGLFEGGRKDAGATQERLCGVMAPHIDPRRGSRCYAWSYKTIAERSDADLFVVLGTAHQWSDHLFLPCDMGFETPLGVVPADHDFMAALGKRYPLDLGSDLLLHRTEHSIEFQAVFLSYVYEGRRPVTIAPVLCGSLLRFVKPEDDPMREPVVRDFVEALRETMANCGRKVCIVAGVDLAHIGPHFGHDKPVEDHHLAGVKEDDLKLLERVASVDAPGFFDVVGREGDRRNICGFSSIFVLLQAAGADRGELLAYGQAPEPQMKSVVTFASMALTQSAPELRARSTEP